MTASFLSVALRHAQDQAVDGLKISGQAEGITPPPARTRTLFRREAGRIGGAARKNKPPSPSSCENRSALRREAQQPLLHRRGEQRAVATIDRAAIEAAARSEEHTSELQSLMRTSYAVFCLQKKKMKQK